MISRARTVKRKSRRRGVGCFMVGARFESVRWEWWLCREGEVECCVDIERYEGREAVRVIGRRD